MRMEFRQHEAMVMYCFPKMITSRVSSRKTQCTHKINATGHCIRLLALKHGPQNSPQPSVELGQAYIFLLDFGINCQMFTSSEALSHASTNATRCHKYSQGLNRLLSVLEVWCHFQKPRFGGKLALLALKGCPQPLKKPSRNQKGLFPRK